MTSARGEAAQMAQVPVPTTRASTGWILRFTLAYIGINIVWAGPGQVLMAPQVEFLSQRAQWGPFTSVKEDNLALIGAIAGVFAVISGPLWGALSDRSAFKWGRRTPWMAVGTVLVAATMAASGLAQTLPALLLSWIAFQIVINAAITPLSAAVPDHVPEQQRGVVSGWYGFGYTFAVVAGTGLGTLATAIWPGMQGITLGYFLCAAACVVAMLPMLAKRWETPLPQEIKESIPRFGWPQLLACFWVDIRKHPDFGWAWLTRFIVTLSTSTTLFYLYYYLQDEIGLSRDDAAVAHGLRVSEGVLLLTAVYAIAVFGTVVIAGVLSDKLGRRKVFVSAAAIFIGIATLLIAFAPNFAVVVVGAIVLGLGTGVFTSVDFALVSQVLPATQDTGKDVGIIHLAITLPNILAPVVAALLVGHLGGYTSLYLCAGGLAILGGILVYQIKGVR